MKKFILMVLACGLMATVSQAAEEGLDLTIYNQNFAFVKDRRTMDLKKGMNEIRFSEIASGIEPASVHFLSLTAPDSCVIQEQNYEYDLVGSDKLLSKYIDKNIKVLSKDGSTYDGTLMSYDGNGLILSNKETKGLTMIKVADNIKNIDFTELPEGLITKPTLMWKIANDKAGQHLTEVSYLTSGVNWNADYVAVIDQEDSKMDLDGWVTINNQSGTAYKNAGLKLIAGDVRRATPQYLRKSMPQLASMDMREAAAPQFSEKAFFEYHIYALQHRTTVGNNQSKQISLLNAFNAPLKKLFIFDPSEDNEWYMYREGNNSKEQKVKVKLEVVNSEANHLGMPLPAGKIKVYKKDTDGKLEFIGEDQIDHTPKDEKIRLYLGDAFDVVGERKRMDFKQYGRAVDETIEISLRNHKEQDIEVVVQEHLWRYINWSISQSSHDYKKTDAQSVEFKIPVPKNAEVKVTYTVHYTW